MYSQLATEFPITPTPEEQTSMFGMFEVVGMPQLMAAAAQQLAATSTAIARSTTDMRSATVNMSELLATAPIMPLHIHDDMPVHSVHHDTVHTEAALESLMSAPESALTTDIPPKMVKDNYCFVVDGDTVQVSDITDDDPFWKHTGRPTNYFYSEDLKKFKRVNVLMVRGRIISAKIVSKTNEPKRKRPLQRTNSPGGGEPEKQAAPGIEEVSVEYVYRVTRFYSFWKTCTNFHRIVTLIARADASMQPHFKKRLFVQYLWRNAKPSEKAMVARDFDPKKQKLLKYVGK